MRVNVNGVDSKEPRVRKMRTRKEDAGHSVILISQLADERVLAVRTTFTCQCGKEMSGWEAAVCRRFVRHQEEARKIVQK